MSRQKDKGTRYEQEVAAFLEERGIAVRRLPPSGSRDKGDLEAGARGLRLTVECKNHRRLSIPEWYRQAEAECANAGTDGFALVCHRDGYGAKRTGESYAVMPLHLLASLLG